MLSVVVPEDMDMATVFPESDFQVELDTNANAPAPSTTVLPNEILFDFGMIKTETELDAIFENGWHSSSVYRHDAQSVVQMDDKRDLDDYPAVTSEMNNVELYQLMLGQSEW
jgi:hypothetical protein